MKNPIFCPFLAHFPHFLSKKIFSKNLVLSRTTTHGPLTPCWVSEKTNEPFPRKRPYGRTERWKDRQILIHRTLVATAGGLKKAPPYPEFQVSKKNLYLFQIFHCIHSLWSPFLKKLKCRKKYLYTQYAALNTISNNATKERR